MLPVAVNLLVAGSYISAVATHAGPGGEACPPAIRTVPLLSTVAVASSCYAVMDPVGEKVPVAGLYNSALVSTVELPCSPPAIKTVPSLSRAVTGPYLTVVILPLVGAKVLVFGL